MSTSFPLDHDMAGTTPVHMDHSYLPRRNSRGSAPHSAYRPSRVEKPRSNHNSPRTAEKRRSTASTKRYATMEDHFNMMLGLSPEDTYHNDFEASSRPMSWHPSSTQFNAGYSTPQDWPQHDAYSYRNSAQGSDFYSLSARNSFHPSQLPSYASYDQTHVEHLGSQGSDTTGPYNASSLSTPATEINAMPWYLQEWARKNETQVHSCNGSTDFLPIQHPTGNQNDFVNGEEDDEMDEDPGKELVGMGLYDLPAQSGNFSSLLEGTGKGLKLEETWQPPDDEDEDDDDDEDADDDGSVDDSSDEDPPPATQQPASLPISDAKPQLAGNLQGQSFFFEEDDSYTKEWWYQQLRNPSMPVRDAGLGHGWL